MKQSQSVQEKKNKAYAVKSGLGKIKAVNFEERTIKAIANTYFLIDEDLDMIVMGAAQKTIEERGPNSSAVAKIKHQSDHRLDTKNVVGRITDLKEMEIDGMSALYFESFIPPTKQGDDHLINYQEGLYDNHSIGFQYVQIELAEKDSTVASEKRNWEEYYPKALNPEVADEYGYFFVIKEIRLWEISIVSYGANTLTPYLGSKAKNQEQLLKNDIIDRINRVKTISKNVTSKQDQKELDLELKQLQQIVMDLKLEKPSKGSTQEEPETKDTDKPSVTALWN